MADDRTTVTELATALGLTGHATLKDAIETRPGVLEIDQRKAMRLRVMTRGSGGSPTNSCRSR